MSLCDSASLVLSPPAECERLIRRMLQLDPSKRIPLASVLKHRFMEGAGPGVDASTHSLRVFGSSDNLLWNDQVLMAIRGMNYNVEACKQVRGTFWTPLVRSIGLSTESTSLC